MTEAELAALVRELDSVKAERGRLAIENGKLRVELAKVTEALQYTVGAREAMMARYLSERAFLLEQIDIIVARSIELDERSAVLLRRAEELAHFAK